MKLDVEPLSQRDWRWAWKRLGNSGSSIYWYGCYLTCLTMLARFRGAVVTVPEMNDLLKKNGGFSGDLIEPAGAVKTLDQLSSTNWKFERKDWEKVLANLDVVKELIDSRYPVIAKVDFNPSTKNIEGHFVLLTGYEKRGTKIAELYAIDPWTGKEIELTKTYPYLKLYRPENAVLGLRIYRGV